MYKVLGKIDDGYGNILDDSLEHILLYSRNEKFTDIYFVIENLILQFDYVVY